MRKRGLIILTMLAIAACAGGCMFLPGDKRKIVNQLNELAEAASADVQENAVIRMADAARVSRYFTGEVVIDTGQNSEPMIQGRDRVAILVTQAQAAVENLQIRFTDVDITVSASDTATAHLTLVLSGRPREHGGSEASASSLDAQELLLAFRKVDDDWLIAHVEVVKTLERPH